MRATIAPPVGADSIDALAIAGAASVGVSTNGLAGAAAGAAAVTVNNIDRSVQAVIQSSAVTTPQGSGGSVYVIASDVSKIVADAGGVAIAVAVSLGNGAGALSIGAAVAQNNIGDGVDLGQVSAEVIGSTINSDNDVQVIALNESSIQALAIAGAVAAAITSGTASVTVAGAGDLAKNRIRRKVRAGVSQNSHVDADRHVNVTATDTSSIVSRAAGAAISAGIARSGTSVALAVGVSLTENEIGGSLEAVIDTSTVNADGSVTVSASSPRQALFTLNPFGSYRLTDADLDAAATPKPDDNTTQQDEAALDAASDAILVGRIVSQFRAAGETISDNVKLSQLSEGHSWLVADQVYGTTSIIRLEDGQLNVSRTTIQALSAAAAVSVAVGQNSVALAGGGAAATNEVLTTTTASIVGGSVTALGDLNIDATRRDGIVATVVALSIGVGVGPGSLAAAAAIGAAVATNNIGYDSDGQRLPAATTAAIDGGTILVTGAVKQTAESGSSIGSVVFAGGAAVSISPGELALSLSGAGASATNTIAADATATVRNIASGHFLRAFARCDRERQFDDSRDGRRGIHRRWRFQTRGVVGDHRHRPGPQHDRHPRHRDDRAFRPRQQFGDAVYRRRLACSSLDLVDRRGGFRGLGGGGRRRASCEPWDRHQRCRGRVDQHHQHSHQRRDAVQRGHDHWQRLGVVGCERIRRSVPTSTPIRLASGRARLAGAACPSAPRSRETSLATTSTAPMPRRRSKPMCREHEAIPWETPRLCESGANFA